MPCFTSDLNSSPLILIASLRGRVGPSKFQVRNQVKQEKRLDRGIEDVSSGLSDAKTHLVSMEV